eukprot:TRINITY_DN19259_c0_g1_i1.p1 TRINITY_DN19259_c0_g1~~TRINITY_DN19259_c0_g1_i1.p1  ORF type:complete len:410 (+),score=84.37 TRINITY_DN19259_c0_g1_i1:224-1453(+)
MASRNRAEAEAIGMEPRARTNTEQAEVEKTVVDLLDEFGQVYGARHPQLELNRTQHIKYLLKGLKSLGGGYAGLDASRPWLVYWIVHSLDLLDAMHLVTEPTKSEIIEFIAKCQHPGGGFSGGPDQDPHIAPTYAAVNALCALGTAEAYQVVDRSKMHAFLVGLKADGEVPGAFYMHHGGEIDIRGSYCGLSVARLLNILTPELTAGCSEFIMSCQTYEGGFGCVAFAEAHGGYTFCGLGAALILGCAHQLNVPKLLNWLTARQMSVEKGFNGRTNKVVDACYSLWQGGAFHLISRLLYKEMHEEGIREASPDGTWLFDQDGLQQYLLIAAQSEYGGLRDKPSKHPDYYHTCYGLSGLSVAQHSNSTSPNVHGSQENLLRETDHIHNVCLDKVAPMLSWAADQPPPDEF